MISLRVVLLALLPGQEFLDMFVNMRRTPMEAEWLQLCARNPPWQVCWSRSKVQGHRQHDSNWDSDWFHVEERVEGITAHALVQVLAAPDPVGLLVACGAHTPS